MIKIFSETSQQILHYQGGNTLFNTEHILHLGLINQKPQNMGQIHSRKFSWKSSKGFFPSFRAGRLLKPTNTMYFTHTSQSQHMLKKKIGLTKNWNNLSSELAFGSLRERWVFFSCIRKARRTGLTSSRLLILSSFSSEFTWFLLKGPQGQTSPRTGRGKTLSKVTLSDSWT